MDELSKTLGQTLLAARDTKKLTLRAVERAVGVSNAYLSQLESGKIKQPSPSVLHKLAELYEISYSEIMGLAGYPVPEQSNTDQPNLSNLASRFGDVTKEEETALREYLEFLRSRSGRKG